MALATNEAWWRDSALRMEAEGYQLDASGVPRMVADDNPDPLRRNPAGIFQRNGGLIAMRRLELAEDNMLYRFGARRYLNMGAAGLLPLANSPWWMEEDRMVLLLTRARDAGVPLAEMARRQLALPLEWTDCDIIVRIRPRPGILLATHAGPGRTAADNAGDRRIIAPEAPHLRMDQIYLPGLGRHPALGGAGQANVSAWFDTTTLRSFDPNAQGFNPPRA